MGVTMGDEHRAGQSVDYHWTLLHACTTHATLHIWPAWKRMRNYAYE